LRLRALREEHWPGVAITQAQLAEALGTGRPLSVPLISSWESASNPKAPPLRRLGAYALFFATVRSVAQEPFRLLPMAELTPAEREVHDQLLDELTALRTAATTSVPSAVGNSGGSTTAAGMWRFPAGQDITIVCARLPDSMRNEMPYTDPADPDYVDMFAYADLDALIELYGHIRAVNPNSQVNFHTSKVLTADDYATHLVLLGGVDWNEATRDLLLRVPVPVRQAERVNEDDDGGFTVQTGSTERTHKPKLVGVAGRRELMEDVAHFCRGPSPYNAKRTFTICNGMFGRGTLGAVRALTDAKFRDRNEDYIAGRFDRRETLSILMRVSIVNGQTVTPDWAQTDTRLHEWPEETLEHGVDIHRGRRNPAHH
jgi:transcriptional regulator with XRE-family HTH domain